MGCPDNYDAWSQHDAEQERGASKLPKCYGCDEPIYDDVLYDIDGDLYCERCMEDRFRKWTENYMN